MKRTMFALSAVLWAILVAGIPAWAHHAFVAAYDMKDPVTVHGVITKVLLQNPHSWFMLDVKDGNGKVEQWEFEAGTPSGMLRNGYKPRSVKPGTEVTIKGFRARDTSQKKGLMRELITADGKTFSTFGPEETR